MVTKHGHAMTNALPQSHPCGGLARKVLWRTCDCAGSAVSAFAPAGACSELICVPVCVAASIFHARTLASSEAEQTMMSGEAWNTTSAVTWETHRSRVSLSALVLVQR